MPWNWTPTTSHCLQHRLLYISLKIRISKKFECIAAPFWGGISLASFIGFGGGSLYKAHPVNANPIISTISTRIASGL
jgi:hypothetical protein